MTNFKKAMKFVLKWEGGFVNDPADPGGATKYGISKRAFPHLDIINLTKEQAEDIYHQHYWIPAGCEKMDLPLAVAVFDAAVNCGVGRAKKWLQKSDTWEEFLQLRLDHYDLIIFKNKALLKFRKGWFNRVADLRKFILQNQSQ